MFRLLTPADYRTMPWKNGGGRTTEIAAYPPGAGLDAFLWRVSLADVERDGPFSSFPGVDRTIVLLEGAGMRLREGERATGLTTPFAPHAFGGDAAIDCKLIAGPVRDFNAMFRRGRACGSVTVVGERETELGPARFRLAYAVTGVHECSGVTAAPIRLEAGHALLVAEAGASNAPSIAIRPLGASPVALVVSVDCS
jgi:environmental stress-induced protein Ves